MVIHFHFSISLQSQEMKMVVISGQKRGNPFSLLKVKYYSDHENKPWRMPQEDIENQVWYEMTMLTATYISLYFSWQCDCCGDFLLTPIDNKLMAMEWERFNEYFNMIQIKMLFIIAFSLQRICLTLWGFIFQKLKYKKLNKLLEDSGI